MHSGMGGMPAGMGGMPGGMFGGMGELLTVRPCPLMQHASSMQGVAEQTRFYLATLWCPVECGPPGADACASWGKG